MYFSEVIIDELVRLKILPQDASVQSVIFFPSAPYDEYDCAIRVFERLQQNTDARSDSKLISRWEMMGNYLNICFYPDEFCRELVSFIDDFSLRAENKYYGKKIAVEHTSITPIYPINLATYRSTVIGEAIKNLLVLAGANVETHFYVEDMARQFDLLRRGVAAISEADLSLRDGDKIDHQIGRIFTTSYVVDCKENGRPIPIAAHKMNAMFPFSHPISIDSLREDCRYTDKELCQMCLDGIKQTLNEVGIEIAQYDFESECLQEGIEYAHFKDSEVMRLLFANSLRIPYNVRNCAYFSFLMKNNDWVFSVISNRQRAVICDSLDFFKSANTINISYFDDVIVNNGEAQAIDLIREGVFHSLDWYLKAGSAIYGRSYRDVNRALKLKLLSTNNNKACFIDDSDVNQYDAYFELLDFYDNCMAHDVGSKNNSPDTMDLTAINKSLIQFEGIIYRTLNEMRFDYLTKYIFSLYDNIKAICPDRRVEICSLQVYPAVKKIFDIAFEIAGVKF